MYQFNPISTHVVLAKVAQMPGASKGNEKNEESKSRLLPAKGENRLYAAGTWANRASTCRSTLELCSNVHSVMAELGALLRRLTDRPL